ncbi:acetolactate synthase [Thiohalorhabdus denitrificans]|uniref:Acetolactate synthase small subunit n=1 Tax=Thiohalorhabdus denitrificans TaxID=381306 RepID=A0A0P9CMW2_9GAMM|nr:acetolactate synthase small subunit [Thiohalorhabdus denitrificans]KPV40426.1 acetolactate synthase [Thiohalorhabdus denitrificans]SCY60493.1 acetolactate synthase, small subunit [Thiohalorhabdus denitrificans]
MRRVISVLLENEAGALSRVAGLFSARGYNIEGLSVAPTDDEGVSRMTIVTWGDDQILEQIIKQLRKLVEVIKVTDLTEGAHVEREMVLLKVQAESGDERAEVKRIADIYRSRIIDITDTSYTLEVTGDGQKVQSMVELFEPSRVVEVVRTGAIAIGRGARGM